MPNGALNDDDTDSFLMTSPEELAAMKAGALGGGISGSGPSMFYLCQGAERAAAVAGAMEQVFKPTGIPYKLYQTQVAREGARSSIA